MPQTEVRFFKDENGKAPVLDWLAELKERAPEVAALCSERIRQLRADGYDLRRPYADLLRDGIHELRFKDGRVHYRLLYFFFAQERNVAIVAHSLTKEGKVPDRDIDRAITCKQQYELAPERHTYGHVTKSEQGKGNETDTRRTRNPRRPVRR